MPEPISIESILSSSRLDLSQFQKVKIFFRSACSNCSDFFYFPDFYSRLDKVINESIRCAHQEIQNDRFLHTIYREAVWQFSRKIKIEIHEFVIREIEKIYAKINKTSEELSINRNSLIWETPFFISNLATLGFYGTATGIVKGTTSLVLKQFGKTFTSLGSTVADVAGSVLEEEIKDAAKIKEPDRNLDIVKPWSAEDFRTKPTQRDPIKRANDKAIADLLGCKYDEKKALEADIRAYERGNKLMNAVMNYGPGVSAITSSGNMGLYYRGVFNKSNELEKLNLQLSTIEKMEMEQEKLKGYLIKDFERNERKFEQMIDDRLKSLKGRDETVPTWVEDSERSFYWYNDPTTEKDFLYRKSKLFEILKSMFKDSGFYIN